MGIVATFIQIFVVVDQRIKKKTTSWLLNFFQSFYQSEKLYPTCFIIDRKRWKSKRDFDAISNRCVNLFDVFRRRGWSLSTLLVRYAYSVIFKLNTPVLNTKMSLFPYTAITSRDIYENWTPTHLASKNYRMNFWPPGAQPTFRVHACYFRK